jgi:hypothetical protein
MKGLALGGGAGTEAAADADAGAPGGVAWGRGGRAVAEATGCALAGVVGAALAGVAALAGGVALAGGAGRDSARAIRPCRSSRSVWMEPPEARA